MNTGLRFSLQVVLVLAGLGFALSVTSHILALLDVPLTTWVFSLHLGIFVVWFPTVLIGQRMARDTGSRDFWRVVLRGAPSWMKSVLGVLFAYAIGNFVLFILRARTHNVTSGNVASPSVVRGFSGHWMVFYGAAFATIYSALHTPHALEKRTCPNGHTVSPLASFCPTCGARLSDGMAPSPISS